MSPNTKVAIAGVCALAAGGVAAEVAFLAPSRGSFTAAPRGQSPHLAEEGVASKAGVREPHAHSAIAPIAAALGAFVSVGAARERQGSRRVSRGGWGSFLGTASRTIGATGRAGQQVRRLFGSGDKEEAPEEEMSEKSKAVCEKLQKEVDDLKQHAEEKKAAHERLTMEVNNFRARTKKELATARGKAAIPLIKELMPIADDFELAKQNLKVEGEGEQAICDRFDSLFTKMLENWKSLGVQKLESVGEEFNPEFHEAVSMIPSGDYKDGVVCNELRAGWVLKPVGSDDAQVLRPSLVCVSSGPGP